MTTGHCFYFDTNPRDNIIQMNNEGKSDEVEECAGFLYKSPPSGLTRIMKSWKQRFFVLAKTSDDTHELRYYRSIERNRLIKSIAVSTVTLLYTRPEVHPAFEWICKSFKCSPASVLFMKTDDPADKAQREYFFIGENSEEIDRWFNALFGALKHTKTLTESELQKMTESQLTKQNSSDTEQRKDDCRPLLPPMRVSAPTDISTQQNHCDQQPKSSPSALEGKQNMLTDETPGESSEDFEMSSGESVVKTSEDSLLDCVTQAFKNLQTPEQKIDGLRMNKEHTRKSSLHFNGICASAKLNGAAPDKSDTHTAVEKEICVRHDDLKSLIFTEESGKPCVSECTQIEVLCPLHKGDQILAVNDLLTDSVEEIRTYLRRLSKDQVKLTIRRLPGSIPSGSESSN
ncbi:pleckstrin homology domain-containing family S member 1 [Xyrauchen texanus]|uniref:pleckstrin homology domain-containing family S member 1 n=1 Tax=Xyrauchen texanus TaxID=154827 RepID=UPI00224258A7|nr:pleckstrin homology domain-containing family S member 1 [Xyrauchen texanus]